MSIRNMMLTFGLGLAAVGGVAATAAADQGAATQSGGGGFQCQNKAGVQVVACLGSVSVLPISVEIKDVRALNDNELTVLSNDLNKISILDGNILDQNKILNDVEVTALQDFLNKFAIDVTKNDIDVCTTVLGGLLCK